MAKFHLIPVLATVIGLSLPTALRAQNPPMNCTPDGIIEVCTLVDTNAAQPAVEAVAPPAAPVPNVTYKSGQLTIIAENVPLSDVLREVSRKTGATLEIPNGSATEPIFANIGPGSVRAVLVALLNGTKFNYVMADSQNTSNTLDKIVLTTADQSTEVAQSDAPESPVQVEQPSLPGHNLHHGLVAQQASSEAAPPQSQQEKQAAFMAAADNARAAAMQRFQDKFADMSAKGMVRTPAPPSQGSPASDSSAPDSPAPDSSSQ
jgi:hypothetical protein